MNYRRTFIIIWISLATIALLGFLVLFFKGLIVNQPSKLLINNLILCNGEKLDSNFDRETYYLQENKLNFCGDLMTDSQTYLFGFLFYEASDDMAIGKFSDSKTQKSGPFRVEITTSSKIVSGKYILQIYYARKLIAEYSFFVLPKE